MTLQDPPRKGDVIRILTDQYAAQPGELVTVTGYDPGSDDPGSATPGAAIYRWTSPSPLTLFDDGWRATDGCYEIVSRCDLEPTP